MAGNNGGGTWVFMGEKMKKGSGGSHKEERVKLTFLPSCASQMRGV